MSLYAGVDGGQSSTLALIGDERGRLLGRGVGPPADLVGEARDSRRQAQAIDTAIDAALGDAKLPADAFFASIACGLSGYDAAEPHPRLSARAERIQVVHDAEIALLGALGESSGIVVIAGTGSVALGVDAGGRRVRVGGWGFLFGDEGSAFWIGRRALTLAMRAEDANEPSALRARALECFSLPSLRAVQHAFAHGELSRAAVACFAPDVLALAQAGAEEAREIRDDAVRALAELVCRADMRMGEAPDRLVSYAGGVFDDEPLRELWRLAVREHVARAVVVDPRAEPAMGALLLAREEGAAYE